MHETHAKLLSQLVHIPISFSKFNSFGYKDDSLSTFMYNNSTFKLICHGGLPTYMPFILEVCEILYLGENAKPPKKMKKNNETSQKNPKHLDCIVSFG
jgi:hypothetical protein